METTIVEFTVGSDEFEHFMGRKPKNKAELEEYAHYIKNGIDAQLDWDVLYEEAANVMK